MNILLRRYYEILSWQVNSKWISIEACRVIRNLFGNLDGKAVIVALDAYLDSLSLESPVYTSTLVDVINEDPLLVCSLDLYPIGMTSQMKERYLHGVGNIHFTFGIDDDEVVELKATRITPMILVYGAVMGLSVDNLLFLGWRDTNTRRLRSNRMSQQLGIHFEDLAANEEFIQTDTNLRDYCRTSLGRKSYHLTSRITLQNRGHVQLFNTWEVKIKYFSQEKNGKYTHRIVPFLSKEYGATLIDLVTLEIGTKDTGANFTTGEENRTIF